MPSQTSSCHPPASLPAPSLLLSCCGGASARAGGDAALRLSLHSGLVFDTLAAGCCGSGCSGAGVSAVSAAAAGVTWILMAGMAAAAGLTGALAAGCLGTGCCAGGNSTGGMGVVPKREAACLRPCLAAGNAAAACAWACRLLSEAAAEAAVCGCWFVAAVLAAPLVPALPARDWLSACVNRCCLLRACPEIRWDPLLGALGWCGSCCCCCWGSGSSWPLLRPSRCFFTGCWQVSAGAAATGLNIFCGGCICDAAAIPVGRLPPVGAAAPALQDWLVCTLLCCPALPSCALHSKLCSGPGMLSIMTTSSSSSSSSSSITMASCPCDRCCPLSLESGTTLRSDSESEAPVKSMQSSCC